MARFFRDKNGNLILWQFPNPPLIAWGLATGLAMVASGKGEDVAELVAFGSLFTWAWLELFQGVTGFRRLLGAIVLIGSVITRLS